MKILVTVKRVADYEARLKINSTNDFIDLDNLNMITNPFDSQHWLRISMVPKANGSFSKNPAGPFQNTVLDSSIVLLINSIVFFPISKIISLGSIFSRFL